ncbi:hypothetical protein PG988_001799 [Apiospora saccharicola]
MTMEESTEWPDHWLTTPNEHGSGNIANTASYGVSPSQHYQIDGDIQALDRKIDYLFGVSQDADTMLFEEVSSQSASQTIPTQPNTTEPSPMELPSYDFDVSFPLSTGLELMTEFQNPVVTASASSAAIMVTHHDEKRKMLIPIRPKHEGGPASVASGLSFTHRGSNSTAQYRQPNLYPSQILPPKRKRMIGSSPSLHCGDLLIAEILTQEFPTPNVKAKRARCATRTCLRCREHKQKCSGGIPCDNCRNLWNKPRQSMALFWTACFDSDLRELDYFEECKLDRLAGVPFKVLDDIFFARQPVNQLLISAFGDPEDTLMFSHDYSYMAKLTNLGQIELMIMKAGFMSRLLDGMYHHLQRIRFGKATGFQQWWVNFMVKIVSSILRESANQAAGFAESAAEALWYDVFSVRGTLHDETQQRQDNRNSLFKKMKNGMMRHEQQQKHLMLYLDWCTSKFQGGTNSSRSLLVLSKLQELDYDWLPANFSGNDTHQQADEAGKILI